MGLGAERDEAISALGAVLSGRALLRGHDGFEQACLATVRNARCPPRRPDCVVVARSADDVVAAVRLAAERDWRIAVCSGGHSWSGSHLRDDGLLLDASALQDLELDVEGRSAWAGPGLRSSALQTRLAEHDLFFPTGHCIGPCLGGYLLQGGFGWHSRELGVGCMSVTAIDVVTADGELVRADEQHNSDLLWAARGAGPGFFGVVVGFRLALHPRPRCTMSSVVVYPAELLDEVMRWAHEVSASVPRSIELMVFLRRGLLGDDRPALQVLAPALADSEEQARRDLEFMQECPLRERAIVEQPLVPTDVRDLVLGSASFYPEGYRYAADNMWTNAPAEDLLHGYRRIAQTLPASPAHMMWMNWRPPDTRPDMAYSLEGNTYMALYSVWLDRADDPKFVDWPTQRMRELEHLGLGIQLADENLGRRPAQFLAPNNARRLHEIRARRDSDGRFHSWMGDA